jgi:hypothetical protein
MDDGTVQDRIGLEFAMGVFCGFGVLFRIWCFWRYQTDR